MQFQRKMQRKMTAAKRKRLQCCGKKMVHKINQDTAIMEFWQCANCGKIRFMPKGW